MRIGILGNGNVGRRLGSLAGRAGHPVKHVTRTAQSRSAEICSWAELVIIALPYSACADALPALASALTGKVVVDATNPVDESWAPLTLRGGNSGAEEIANLLPGSTVVKAFNTIFADVMQTECERRISTFIAGNDELGNQIVASLAAEMGFHPVVVGPLRLAAYLEGMAHLNIAIAVGRKGDTAAAFFYDPVAIGG